MTTLLVLKAFIKKYGKYLIILLPAILIGIYVIFFRKKPTTVDDGSKETNALKDHINEIKDQLTEAHQQAAIEVAVAKTKNEEVKKKLEETTSIEDDEARRAKLLDLFDSVQNGG